MVIINVDTKEALNWFYANSMMAFEGISIESSALRDLIKCMRARGYEKEEDPTLYCIKGSFMNEVYGLTGTNAYPDDLHIIVVSDFYEVGFKFAAEARWFDDIVDNNSIRQHAIDTDLEADYR